MSLLWKLIFQKTNLRNFIITASGLSIVLILIVFSGNSCGLQHMQILNEINSYEQTLEPEFCEVVVEKIDLFNDDCEPKIEILDCG